MFGLLLILQLATSLALAKELASEAQSFDQPIKSREDVQKLILRGTTQPSDWATAYAVMQGYLSVFPNYEFDVLDDFELLGLPRERLRRKLACHYGNGAPSEDGDLESYFYGCGQGGTSITVKYESNRVVAVQCSSYISGLGLPFTPDPWVTSKIEGLRKAELNVSTSIKGHLRDSKRDFGWCE